ncbi:MAG TPA: hypothetical protein VJQ83_09740, partial [Tepidiformaceae bacterium]|nr:hypothetical protein [Tepidiformaceae bacterium]
LDELRSGARPGADDTSDELLAAIRAVDVLILDDLASHNATPWAQEKLFQIINYRNLSAGPTVVTMDQPVESLGQPRVAGRLSDPHHAAIIFINAPHYTLGHRAQPEAPRNASRTRRQR